MYIIVGECPFLRPSAARCVMQASHDKFECVASAALTNYRALTMDATERIQAASKFLLQAPPGEINDVLNGTQQQQHYPTPTAQLTRPCRCAQHNIRRRVAAGRRPPRAARIQPRAVHDRRRARRGPPGAFLPSPPSLCSLLTNHVRAQAIVSEAARLPGEDERFFDPRSKTSFVFDHLTLVSERTRTVSLCCC